MKKFVIPTAVFFLSMLVFAGSTLEAGEKSYGKDQAQQDKQEIQQQQLGASGQIGQEGQIQAAEDLEGMKIKSAQGEELGEIEQLLVDTQEGRIGYVIVSSGEILGMAGEKYIVPFSALTLDQQQKAFTLQMDAEKMKQAPKGDIQQAIDREKGLEIHQFYGASPYWEEGTQRPGQGDQMKQDMMQKKDHMKRDMMQKKDHMMQDKPEVKPETSR